MRQIEQLELGLWEVLKEAAIAPDEADVGQLLDGLDAALLSLDTVGQLQVAAEAISQIAQVFCDRSALAFEELEATTSDEGPVMPTEAFDQYVRQTMEVDFDQFIKPLATLPRKITERQAIAEGDSVVGELNRTTVLQVLDQQMSQEPDLTEAEIFNHTWAIAHDEDVAAWARAIAQWMAEQQVSMAPLVELQQSTGMPLIQLWLALLLGGFTLQQRGEFYETAQIWVLS
ncbi:hypothetical protein JOY44_29290 (plasmid) [Phormidium sp. CLA17]|uniref:hypothetical protein n=1 Tax=Leptolyngbya sp. Cla-17 TaxID=2803751 RepID=UPI001492E2C9|nr:hypothetical protein [Leptolyngbya sp. Cla-17]MBM0745516.1 hypothetical protein [Leptolyngbya sp. Cla-17]